MEQADLSFQVHSVSTDKDITEMIGCIVDVYGDTYLHTDLYDPAAVRREIDDGSLFVAIAENSDGQVGGCIMLFRSAEFHGMYECGGLVTKKWARGKQLSSALVAFLLQLFQTMPCEGVFARGTIAHPITQHFCNSASMTPTGFLFHLLSRTLSEQFGFPNERISALLAVLIKNKEKLHTLFVPNELRPFIKDLFDQEHLRYEWGDEAPVTDPAEPAITVVPADRITNIMIDACDDSLSGHIDCFLQSDDGKNTEAIFAFVNANQPSAPLACRILREKGFVFTGAVPGPQNGDLLIFDHRMGLPFHREKTVLAPNYAELLDRLAAINGEKW